MLQATSAATKLARPSKPHRLQGGQTDAIVNKRLNLPALAAVARYEGAWDRTFIEKRSESLLGRAWDVIYPWLIFDEPDSRLVHHWRAKQPEPPNVSRQTPTRP